MEAIISDAASAQTAGTPAPTAARTANPALHQLYRALGHNDEIVARFVADFLRLLPERLHRLEQAARSDLAEAVPILRSLETTSTMLGGEDLASAAARLRRDGDQLDAAGLGHALTELRRSADALAAQLHAASLRGAPGATAPGPGPRPH